MAIIQINYDCGCGFHARTEAEAGKHVDNLGHTLVVSGGIRPEAPRARRVVGALSVSTGKRTERPTTTPQIKVQDEERIDFNNLRARLQRR